MIDRVDYTALDQAKAAFIAASQRTSAFAQRFGFMPGAQFGASANLFALDLKPFLQTKQDQLYMTLLPEGLGTADDARPNDLSTNEAILFWKNIGLKTMAVLTNDAASAGIQTILLSLYLPSSTPELVFNKQFMAGFLDGIVAGCEQVGCVYFSGETPQLKTKIYPGVVDIAGALFGIMPAGQQPIRSSTLQAGDTIVFIGSTGPHENGFTTLRSLAEQLPNGYRTVLPSGQQYWQAINQPAYLYTPFVQALLQAGIQPSNVEPVTGHGWQKLMRPKQLFHYVIEQMLPVPEIFQFVEQTAKLSKSDMLCTFNYGVGLAVFVHDTATADQVVAIAQQHQLPAIVAGSVVAAEQRSVVVKPLDITLTSEGFALQK